MIGEKINIVPRLTEALEGDYEADLLGGVMANIDYVRSKRQVFPDADAEAETEIEIRVADQYADEALHVIGADNIRGAQVHRQEQYLGKDNLRGRA